MSSLACVGWLQLVAVAALATAAAEVTALAQPRSARTVLVVHWGTEDFPTNLVEDAGIRTALMSGDDPAIDYFAEYLESETLPAEAATLALRNYIAEKYAGRRIDLVVAVAQASLQFALRFRADLFPDAPIVYRGIAEVDTATRNSGAGVTGLLTSGGFSETLKLALDLHPDTEHVFVVAQGPVATVANAARAQLDSFTGQVDLTFVTDPSLPRVIDTIKTAGARSLVLYIRASQESPAKMLIPAEVAALVAGAAPVPVYGVSHDYIGAGVVGGAVYISEALGNRLGEIARQVLKGTRPQDIPIERPAMFPVFDWRQLGRWGIAESSLPAGSVLEFREISVWERYRTPIALTVTVLLLQSALIGGLIAERRRRRRAEMESRRNLAALAHMDRRGAMGELAASLAHELNQPLNAILQNAGVAKMLLASNSGPPALPDLAEIVDDIRKDDMRASEVIRRMRSLLQKHELESHPIDLNELAHETGAIVQPDAKARDIRLEMDLADRLPPIRGDRVHLQQVLLNLLMNAMDAVSRMPADQRRVRVWTAQNDHEVRVGVTDCGTGIPADRLSQVFEPFYTTKRDGLGMGMGLAIARSIVEAHAGRIAAENSQNAGATVWFSMPIDEEVQRPG
jgi:signal transduction histidine kinase